MVNSTLLPVPQLPRSSSLNFALSISLEKNTAFSNSVLLNCFPKHPISSFGSPSLHLPLEVLVQWWLWLAKEEVGAMGGSWAPEEEAWASKISYGSRIPVILHTRHLKYTQYVHMYLLDTKSKALKIHTVCTSVLDTTYNNGIHLDQVTRMHSMVVR